MTTFLSDAFTDTDGTTLQSHTPDVGGAWEELATRLHTGSTAATDIVIVSNGARCSATSPSNGYRNTAAPSSAEYDVAADLIVAEAASANAVWSLGARLTDSGTANSAVDRYTASYVGSGTAGSRAWVIHKAVAGGVTTLASTAENLSAGTYVALFEVRDASKTLYVGGVAKVTTADNSITQVGRVAIGCPRNTSGNAIDNLTAATVSSGTTVNGNQATETDTAQAGTPSITRPGALTTETDSANPGAASVTTSGSLATETDTPQAGSAAVSVVGSQSAETDTANAGTPTVYTSGQLATSTETALAGSPVLTLPTGSQASETDTPHPGAPSAAVGGALAAETGLAQAGTPQATLPGQQAAEAETALAGSIRITLAGSRADEILTAQPGTPHAVLLGQLAVEIDEALAGVPFQRQDTPTPAERIYRVAAENRVHVVEAESRVLVIPAESRVLEVVR